MTPVTDVTALLCVCGRVCGSYADMNAGLPSEAFKDFSGGVHMTYKLKEVHDTHHDEELWTALSNATKCKSMICSGTAQKGVKIQSRKG